MITIFNIVFLVTLLNILHIYLKINDSDYLNGVIDLAFKKDKKWSIIDFKTGKAKNEAEQMKKEKAYQPQLDIYSQAWKKINGREPAQAEIYWLD